MGVKIRGIYATALTKLLTDKKFNIVEPSDKINERFELDEIDQSAHTLIYDKDDLNGVTIHGSKAEDIVKLFRKELPDTVFWKMETGSIYCGKIESVDRENKMIFINIGKKKQGSLSLQNYWGMLKEGEKVLVQVKGESKDNFLLSTKLRLFGNNLILIKGGFTKVSKHIKNKTERDRLLSLSDDAKSKGWGVLWKVLAEKKSDDELKKEIENLIKEEENIKKSFEKSNDVALLKQGLCIYFIDFGKKSKEKLDEIRRKASSTVTGHHCLKSGGFSLLADVADNLVEKIDDKKLYKTIEKEIISTIKPGQFFCITQKKIGGRDIQARGIVLDVKNDLIKIKRHMKHTGKYDGLDIDIEPDDYCVSKVKYDTMFVQHEYYDSDEKLKGKYFSVCTPIEIFPESARCTDLEIDVVEKDGKMEIIDKEKLDSTEGIDANLKKEAMKIASDIKKGELKW